MKIRTKKILSVIFAAIMIMCIIPFGASASNSNETKKSDLSNIRYEILAGTFDFGTLETVDLDKSISFYLKNNKQDLFDKYSSLTIQECQTPVRALTSFGSDQYYICFVSTGNMVTGLGDGVQARANEYSSSNTNQLWVMESTPTTNVYVVRSVADNTKCLMVSSSGAVTVGTYQSGNNDQLWQYEPGTMGNGLISLSTYSYGCYLCTNNSTALLLSTSITNYTKIGFLSTNYWIPCSSIDMSDVTLSYQQGQFIYPTFYGTGGQMSNVNGNYVNYTSYSPSVVTTGNGYSNNYLQSVGIGIVTVIIKHKITKITTSIKVQSGPAYFSKNVTPVVQSGEHWCWAACAIMMASDCSTNHISSQQNIVTYILGYLSDQPVSIEQCAEACTYATLNTVSFSDTNSQSYNALATHLFLYGAIEILYTHPSLEGHACVVDGFDLSGSDPRFYVIDPGTGIKELKTTYYFNHYDSYRTYNATVWHY